MWIIYSKCESKYFYTKDSQKISLTRQCTSKAYESLFLFVCVGGVDFNKLYSQ